MKHAKEVRRIYPFSDGNMLQKAYYLFNCLTRDILNYTAFAGKFNTVYLKAFEDAIAAAQDAPQDNQIIDILAQKTELVNKQMEKCRQIIMKERYFLEEAFKDNKPVLNEFGYNDYLSARDKKSEMARYLRILVTANVKYNAELIAAGFDQTAIDEVKATFDRLITVSNDQEYYKGERIALTQSRIEKMNAVWEIVLDVAKAGKIIFIDNYAKQRQYIIRKSSSETGDDFSGEIEGGISQDIINEDVPPSSILLLKNTGSTNLLFCMSDDVSAPCINGIEVTENQEKSIIVAELGSGNRLVVTNKSSDARGSYSVTIS